MIWVTLQLPPLPVVITTTPTTVEKATNRPPLLPHQVLVLRQRLPIVLMPVGGGRGSGKVDLRSLGLLMHWGLGLNPLRRLPVAVAVAVQGSHRPFFQVRPML